MKKTILALVSLLTALIILVPCAASADPYLTSLTHNCKNTGKMLPSKFDPNVTSYILTVASWVSRVKFTPVASDPNCTVTVNGSYVAQGKESQIIQMTNDPQQVLITVTAPDSSSRTYTIFLQRRPSERRTRVSAGYINDIYVTDNKWYIDADLVTVEYVKGGGNLSTFTNKTQEHYKYACTEDCILYVGDINFAIRMKNMNEFKMNYDAAGMYRFVYIEDEIVAVMPYGPDSGY